MSLMDISLLVAAYLIGAVPTGLVVARLMGGADLRGQGSGNIGATNATRVLGKGAGVATLAGDLFKGSTPVWVAAYLGGESVALMAAGAAVIGHVFPVYLRFRGGKGVATGFGVLMALNFPIALTIFFIWVASYKLFKVSALSALIGYGALPLVAWLMGPGGNFLIFCVALSVLILLRHKDNVQQLLAARNG